MYDDGESDSETAYASPRARVDASDDDRDGNGFDSTIRSSRSMAPEDGARRRGEPPVEVTMTRTREGNASRGMIRPSRAMAIDVATLRHVFERIDANGDGKITRDELATWVRSVLPAAQAADKYITALFDLADHDQSGDLSVEELAWLLDSVQDHQHHDSVHHQAAGPAANSP